MKKNKKLCRFCKERSIDSKLYNRYSNIAGICHGCFRLIRNISLLQEFKYENKKIKELEQKIERLRIEFTLSESKEPDWERRFNRRQKALKKLNKIKKEVLI